MEQYESYLLVVPLLFCYFVDRVVGVRLEEVIGVGVIEG